MAFTLSPNKFKSSQFIFAKIKRELSSFGAVGKFDEADFALYTAEVLKELGIGVYKEADAVLTVVDGRAELPKDFSTLYAAYKCCKLTDEVSDVHYQGGFVLFNDVTCEVLARNKNCRVECECPDQILQKITVRQYAGQDCCRTRTWEPNCLLRVSPNVRDLCDQDSPSLHCKSLHEITIRNGCAFVNYKKADIFIQYYAFPLDEDNCPLIPDIVQIEKCIEYYILYQLFMRYWLDGSVSDVQNKWQKLEQLYHSAFAESKYILKLPQFQTLINSTRRTRTLNKTSFFAQIDNKTDGFTRRY